MIFVDTQVLITAAQHGDASRIYQHHISSITANEFLEVQIADPSRARYYLPQYRDFEDISAERIHQLQQHPFSRFVADYIIIEFGNTYPTIREYNSQAIATAINKQQTRLFGAAISTLQKNHRKRLRRQFQLLTDARITCHAIRRPDIETALDLLDRFTQEHMLKSNFRNSWNDLLILAVTANANGTLLTHDSLLARFSTDVLGGRTRVTGDGLTLSFPESRAHGKQKRQESKGYINRGWRIQMHRR